MTNYTPGETKLLIPGPLGDLEARLLCPNTEKHARFGIICHPHPLFEGNMNNKVVTTVARLFRDMGIPSIRFNFRGVGKSAGEFGDAVGESDDLVAVFDWVKTNYPECKIWLAGFSFGSYIAMRVSSVETVDRLILIAPSVDNFDYQSLKEPDCPWIIVQGDKDEIVPVNKVLQWAKSRINPPLFIRMQDATHFFHGRLVELKQNLEQVLQF